jgi:hypothetical protein
MAAPQLRSADCVTQDALSRLPLPEISGFSEPLELRSTRAPMTACGAAKSRGRSVFMLTVPDRPCADRLASGVL